jgi:hypothetical protein
MRSAARVEGGGCVVTNSVAQFRDPVVEFDQLGQFHFDGLALLVDLRGRVGREPV